MNTDERQVCDLDDGLDEILSQAVDMFEEAMDGFVQAFDIMEIFEIGGPFTTSARVAQKPKGNVMQVIY